MRLTPADVEFVGNFLQGEDLERARARAEKLRERADKAERNLRAVGDLLAA